MLQSRKRSILLHPLVKPGLGHGPEPVGDAARDAQRLGGLLVTQPRKVTELDQLSGPRIVLFQLTQGLVQGEKVVVGGLRQRELVVPLHTPALSPTFLRTPAASVVHEDAAHGLGTGGKEMAAMVPALLLAVAQQPQIGFVDQGGRLQRLAGCFLGKLLGRQAAQLVVDQRQQLAGGVRIALLDGVQDLSNFVHRK